MADPVTGALVSQLGVILDQLIRENIRLVVGVDTEIKKLKFTLISIQAVILDADNKQFKDHAINLWLQRLGDVCYDLDDVLADRSIALFKFQNRKTNTSNKKVFYYITFPCFCFKKVIKYRDIGLKIKDLHEKLNEIHLGREKYNLNEISSSNVGVGRLPADSFVDESKIKGRDEEKTNLVEELLKERKERLNIVSLVGMGGIGKTTLAQVAYNSDEVKDHFEMRLWVVVSDPFDLVRIAKAIIERIDGNKDPLFELDPILNRLREKIKEKRYLLVLDDAWTHKIENWEPLKNSLGVGAYGSTILVTTRNEEVAKKIPSTKIIPLGVLSDEYCWDLFSQYAFFYTTNEELEHLKPIGRDIAYKCKGLPLAAKTIGSLLMLKNNVEDWQNVLNSDTWDLKCNILPPLLLSYYALEEYAWRRCFRYCAVFPKDTTIEAEDLIQLWMANGYLISKGSANMEAIGREYLENLAQRCFFQDLERDKYTNNIKQFKMHDMIHDLAQHLTKNECSTIEVVDNESPRTEFRHLTLVITNDVSLQSIQGDTTKLHTLRAWSTNDETEEFLPDDLFKHLLHLKVLDVSENTMKEVPNDIGKLLNLRYLNLSYNQLLEELPETLCELYNLQTLNLNHCIFLKRLPEGIGKLENLRHLKIYGTMFLSELPRGIRNLRFLQTLDGVDLSNKEDTFNVGDLMDLKQLRGSFVIKNLGYADVADAKKAKLKEKQHLVNVFMNFYPETLSSEEVAEALELHHDVKVLRIWNYGGVRFPSWIISLNNVRELELKWCQNCTVLPPLGKLQSLETLTIKEMKNVKRIGEEFLGNEDYSNKGAIDIFPKLKFLEFSNMTNWEEWDLTSPDIVKGVKDGNLRIMPCLKKMLLDGCIKLKELPALGKLQSLERLEISGMKNVKRIGEEFLGIEDYSNKGAIDIFPKLKDLHFAFMDNWEEWDITSPAIVKGVEDGNLRIMPCLQDLTIHVCRKLKEVPEILLRTTQIREPRIIGCPLLEQKYGSNR